MFERKFKGPATNMLGDCIQCDEPLCVTGDSVACPLCGLPVHDHPLTVQLRQSAVASTVSKAASVEDRQPQQPQPAPQRTGQQHEQERPRRRN